MKEGEPGRRRRCLSLAMALAFCMVSFFFFLGADRVLLSSQSESESEDGVVLGLSMHHQACVHEDAVRHTSPHAGSLV